jgi:glycosyltransferase involved in cell wall biosynthesis
MRVIHVNDVAGVASTAVAEARAEGYDWELWPLPAVRGAAVPVKLVRRARDLAGFHPAGRGADLLHVHYGLFGYYAWSVRRPYVLHLHGTDVRVNLNHPVQRRLVLRSVRRAAAVIYSTPDLGPAVTALRPDALWVPAPLPSELAALRRTSAEPTMNGGVPRVVFASRWDPVKGLDELIDLAAQLRVERPDAELVGIDWGAGAGLASSAGVRLQPVMRATQFRELLAGADVVIGQQLTGVLGISDLEAMALGRPLVARFTAQDAYGADAPLWNTASGDPVAAVAAILDDPVEAARRARTGPAWVLRYHSAAAFVERLAQLYQEVAGSGG